MNKLKLSKIHSLKISLVILIVLTVLVLAYLWLSVRTNVIYQSCDSYTDYREASGPRQYHSCFCFGIKVPKSDGVSGCSEIDLGCWKKSKTVCYGIVVPTDSRINENTNWFYWLEEIVGSGFRF